MSRPRTICTATGCSELSPCPLHARRPWQRNEGLSASARGYGSEWRQVRARVLEDEPYCRVCGAPANSVDHIVPRARGGSEARSNLQSLCESCHRKKTGQDSHRGPVGFFGTEGGQETARLQLFPAPRVRANFPSLGTASPGSGERPIPGPGSDS